MTTRLPVHNATHIAVIAILAVLAWLLAVAPLQQIGLVVALSAGAILLVRWPWLAWLGLAATLPFASAIKLGPLSATDAWLLLALSLWFADGVRQRHLIIEWSAPPILAIVYVAALLLSMLGAADLGEAVKEVVKWSEFALILLILPAVVRPAQTQWLVVALLIGAMGQAILGIYQFFSGIGPEWFAILGGYVRASGTFLQPNPFAGYLGLSLPVALSLTIWSVGNLIRRHGRWQTEDGLTAGKPWWDLVGSKQIGGTVALALFYATATAVIGAGLLASWSRGGWLGAVGGVAVVIVFRSRRTLLLSALLLLILSVALLLGTVSTLSVPAPLVDRLQDLPTYVGAGNILSQPVTDENFSVIERLAHWVAALRMWEGAPWLGVGPGSYDSVYASVRLPQWEEPLGHAHNIYLNVLGETGMVGLLAYGLFWIGTIGWTVQRLRRSGVEAWSGALALGVLGVLAHLTVHNGFDNLFVQGIYLHVALWLGSLIVLQRSDNQLE